MRKFQKGDSVWINFQDGDKEENYTGSGTFIRKLKENEPCYEYLKEPHAFVRIGAKETAVFPMYAITPLNKNQSPIKNALDDIAKKAHDAGLY
jgi:uracil-DNA glycosylase